MSLIVQKFGGSSVRDAQRVLNVARRVTETYARGNSVVVVVSAQGDTTDDLIEKAREINPKANKREMDVLLSSGEQISIALLAMAIEGLGYPAKSLTGWQAGFVTDSAHGNSRIRRVETERIKNELDKGNIVIVAGFQGLNRYDDITTLGRGGSDTSAVAIAAACRADLCQSWPAWGPRCSTTAAWRWRRNTMFPWRCSPALPKRRGRSSRRWQRWKKC